MKNLVFLKILKYQVEINLSYKNKLLEIANVNNVHKKISDSTPFSLPVSLLHQKKKTSVSCKVNHPELLYKKPTEKVSQENTYNEI